MTRPWDIAVVGGGIMGCATALGLAEGGMRVVVLDKGDLCQGASGVNAGTLSLQIKRVSLMDYALRGHELWEAMGDAVGFRKTGGYTLAFTPREAALLEERQTLKRAAGAPITFVSPKAVWAAEPGIADSVVAASYCPEDGYANSSLTGAYYRARLTEAGIAVRVRCPVEGVEASAGSFALATPDGPVRAARLLLAGGAWLAPLAAMLGVDLPVRARVNTVSVTEAMPALFSTVIGHATGLLTMKQKPNGTVLIGGGWQGRGTPDAGRGQVSADTLAPNVALACHAVPALQDARLLRSWTGFEANVPDFYPLAGALGGVEGAYVLGCVRGGFTIGPYLGRLMADLILGRAPERPLFDPNRSFEGDT
ncbi:FAD-binding oxidoreductase [Rhodobacteraceae bacterium CCMM004]|nr:FAD-binding oxidoreductase [Rhodobacteraceae bacterium CCMM004]